MVVLNCIYVKYVARVQTFFTVVKVLALVVIVITGFVQIGLGKVGHPIYELVINIIIIHFNNLI